MSLQRVRHYWATEHTHMPPFNHHSFSRNQLSLFIVAILFLSLFISVIFLPFFLFISLCMLYYSFHSWLEYLAQFPSFLFFVYIYLKISLALQGLPGWHSGKESASQCRRCGFDPWVRKILWRRKCNPLQYSGLKNPMDSPWGHKSQAWLSI